MSDQALRVGAFDRLSFTVFLALAIHAILIFGISFTSELSQSRSPTLDVTLSLNKNDDKIKDEDADFLADADQQGSGTLEDKAILKTTEQAEIEDNQIFHTTPTIQQLSFSELSVQHDRIIASDARSDFSALTSSDDDGSAEQPIQNDETIILNNITDVATLKALLDQSRQSYAKRPRIRTLTAMSTRRAIDANYIFGWLQKVERIGNQNYPDAARKQRISGAVRLAVAINSDGSLRRVEVSESSGSSVLDQAAKQIVYLSAPFTSFSAEMLEEYEVLEIIRTWQFRVDNSFGLADG
jgi:protein TonB